MKMGDRVRLTEAFKAVLRGQCGIEGSHPGGASEEDCMRCSSGHADEFDQSVGTVQGLTDWNGCPPRSPGYDPSKIGPEWDVRWDKDDLRYVYAAENLEMVE